MGRYESNKLSLTSFRQILLLPHSTKTRSIKFPPPVEDVARTVGKNDQSVVVGCRDGVVQLEFKFADESTDDGSKLQISELRLGNNVSRSPPTASETEKKNHLFTNAPMPASAEWLIRTLCSLAHQPEPKVNLLTIRIIVLLIRLLSHTFGVCPP